MQDDKILIKKGTSIRSVANQLKEHNPISSNNFYTYLAVLKNTKIVFGKYQITKDMTANEILGRLSIGEVIKERLQYG